MADFPAAITTPRTMVNRPGVVYDALKTKVIYAEDFNEDRAEIVAIETELGTNPAGVEADVAARLDAIEASILGKDGWQAVPDSWAYASPSTITVPSGAASLYKKGDKIKFTQDGTVKYFSVIGVANTVLTVTGGMDYEVEDTATYPITLISYSHILDPIGFPAYFNADVEWNLTTSDNGAGGSPATGCLFRINGNFCWLKFGDHTATWKKVGAGNTIVVTTYPVASADGYTAVGHFSSEQGGALVLVGLVRSRSTTLRIEFISSIADNTALYGSATCFYRI